MSLKEYLQSLTLDQLRDLRQAGDDALACWVLKDWENLARLTVKLQPGLQALAKDNMKYIVGPDPEKLEKLRAPLREALHYWKKQDFVNLAKVAKKLQPLLKEYSQEVKNERRQST